MPAVNLKTLGSELVRTVLFERHPFCKFDLLQSEEDSCHRHERTTGSPDVRGSGFGDFSNRNRGRSGRKYQSHKGQYQERR